jgi:inner membrane protein
MPSPLAHVAMGVVVYKLSKRYLPSQVGVEQEKSPPLLLIAVSASLLPDLDAIPGVLLGNFNKYHNHLTHSLLVGAIVAGVVGFALWLRYRYTFTYWFGVVLLAYELHVLMDFFTVGRGVMLFWPFSADRYEAPVKLFYGLRRGGGWLSTNHIWTLFNELGFAAILLLMMKLVHGVLDRGMAKD